MKTRTVLSALRYIAALLLVAPGICLGQGKVPVFLDSTVGENDLVGQQFVFEIKEAIRGSQGFRLVDDWTRWPYIRYIIVTLRHESGLSTNAGYSIVYDSTKMSLSGAFITGGVQSCGRERVSSCARSALSDIDRAVEHLQREAPALWKTLN